MTHSENATTDTAVDPITQGKPGSAPSWDKAKEEAESVTKGIKAQIIQHERELAILKAALVMVDQNASRLSGMPGPVIFFHWNGSNYLDFDKLNREQVVSLLKAFPGRWQKTPSSYEGKIDYETEFEGVKVRAYAGEPPPSCKIIEEEVEVPEQIIPAHKEIKRRMVCGEEAT